MSLARSFGGVAMRVLVDRKVARDRRALADYRIDAHLAAVQLDEGAHQRQAEAGATVPRAVGMALEPVEHLVFHVSRNAGAAIADGEYHSMRGPLGADRDRGIVRRESDVVGEQVIKHLHHAPLVAGKIAD